MSHEEWLADNGEFCCFKCGRIFGTAAKVELHRKGSVVDFKALADAEARSIVLPTMDTKEDQILNGASQTSGEWSCCFECNKPQKHCNCH